MLNIVATWSVWGSKLKIELFIPSRGTVIMHSCLIYVTLVFNWNECKDHTNYIHEREYSHGKTYSFFADVSWSELSSWFEPTKEARPMPCRRRRHAELKKIVIITIVMVISINVVVGKWIRENIKQREEQ